MARMDDSGESTQLSSRLRWVIAAATALAASAVLLLAISTATGAFSTSGSRPETVPTYEPRDREPQRGSDPGRSSGGIGERPFEIDAQSAPEQRDEVAAADERAASGSGAHKADAPDAPGAPEVPHGAAPAPSPAPTIAPAEPAAHESSAVLAETNAHRAVAGGTALARNSVLVARACAWAAQMAAADALSHSSGYGDGFSAAAENVAAGYATGSSVVAGWMASDGHRGNILDPVYTQMGACSADSASGVRYWAQQFGA